MNVNLARERIASALATTIHDNPVVVKEFRSRMRGWKAFVVMGAYCGLMSVVLMIAYAGSANEYTRYQSGSMRVAIGGTLFVALTRAQAILLTLIVPSLSSSSITHELEKRTIEMLALTRLTAGKIVLGKQFADFIFTLMLLACSLPLAGITLMLGGISPAEIVVTYLLLAGWTFLLTCAGTMFSSLSRKSAVSSLITFGLSMLYFIFTAISGAAIMVLSHHYGGPGGLAASNLHPFILLNPAWGPQGALESTVVCGVTVPVALSAFLLHVGHGVLFLLVAASHVLHKPAERALPVRLLLLVLGAHNVIFGLGGFQGLTPTLEEISTISIWLLIYAVICATVFSTGIVKKPEGGSMMGYALSPRRVFKSDIGGAILWIILYMAVCYGSFGVALRYSGNWASTAPVLPSRVHMPPGTLQALPPLGTAGIWQCYWQLGASLLAITAGMAAVGVLASSLTKTRNNAAALVILFAVLMFGGYGVLWGFSAVTAQGVSSQPPLPSLMALWPLTPMLIAGGELSPDVISSWADKSWLVVSLVYILIGYCALKLAGVAHRKTGGVVEE